MEEEKKRETMKGESEKEREGERERERKAYRRTIPKGWRR